MNINNYCLNFKDKINDLTFNVKCIIFLFMRLYTVKFGKFGGNHYIFDSNTEAVQYLSEKLSNLNVNQQNLSDPLDAFPHWSEGIVGDWVRSDDGRILQILNIYKGKSNGRTHSARTGNWVGTKMVKTVVKPACLYGKADGTIVIPCLLADPKSLTDVHFNRSAIGQHKTIAGKYLTMRKRLFAYYVYLLADPIRAYNIVFNVRKRRFGHYNTTHVMFKLLKDEWVVKEIQSYLVTDMEKESFKDRLVKALEDKNLGPERFAKELDEGLNKTKPGSMSHSTWVKMLGQIDQYAFTEKTTPGLDDKGLERKQIEEKSLTAPMLKPPKAEIFDRVDKSLIEYTKVEEGTFEEITKEDVKKVIVKEEKKRAVEDYLEG